MRLLFVSSTTDGGSGRSQRELAGRMVERGHEVAFLVDDGRPARLSRWAYGHLSDLAVRTAGRPGACVAAALSHRPGRRISSLSIDGLDHRASAVPQNAALGLIPRFRPDVVVGSSLERLAWRELHAACRGHGVPTVLYIRETDSLEHLAHGEVPDLLIANAESLQSALHARQHPCAYVPSLTNLDPTRTTSSRRTALFVNPLPTHGIDLLWQLADRLPHIPFVVQESRPSEAAWIAVVRREASSRANVEVRALAPPGPHLYRDARVLLVPHRIDNRPRIIAEAQSNGIPVIASDLPGLREAAGPGGLFLPPDDVERWAAGLSEVWEEGDRYAALSATARAHSARPEMDPDAVSERFERLVHDMVTHVRHAQAS